MSLYGPLVTARDVRVALTDHLRTWTPAYIAEVGRQRSVTMVGFRGYGTSVAIDLPVCVTACAGTEGDPERHGDGSVTAPFVAEAAAVVSGETLDQATDLASYYGAAIRAAVAQHPSLGGFAVSTQWAGETLEEIGADLDRSIAACTQRFLIVVNGVMNVRLGPVDVPAAPDVDPGDLPTVEVAVSVLARE